MLHVFILQPPLPPHTLSPPCYAVTVSLQLPSPPSDVSHPSMPSPLHWCPPYPGQSPPVGQYSRSLSEDRFNALRREYQEYRRAQESVGAPQARLANTAAAGRGSDSDSGSALL